MREQKVDELLDDLQHHARADDALARTVLAAIQDGAVTDAERRDITAALHRVETTRGLVRWHGEKLRAAIRIARALLFTGELTPKVQRTARELERDLADLQPERAA